jgi:hypothetical protein
MISVGAITRLSRRLIMFAIFSGAVAPMKICTPSAHGTGGRTQWQIPAGYAPISDIVGVLEAWEEAN